MPEVAAQFEYVPQVEFDYDACLAQFEALQQSSSVVLMLVDGLVWQTPLLVAAEQGIPAVLCFEQSVHAGVLAGQWMQSRWRRQQSFMWSFEVLCVDSSTVDFFVSERCLASAQYSLVVAPEARTSTWWYEQVQSWRKRYRHFLAQSRYLQKHSFDLDYFIGSEQWRRNNSLEQQLVHFLFAWRLQLYMRQLIPGFDMSSYAQHHPQLQDRNPLVDFLKRRRPEGPWSKRLIQPGQAPTVVPRSSGVALHIHAYYIDSLPGLLQALTCNKIRPDLFISVRNEADLAQAQQQCALYPVSVCIRVVPNRGRDIGPFLTEFGPELVANYRIIGHVHTKQSLFHTERDFITAWQDFLLVHALGNTKYPMADEIVGAMQQNPTIGMVFADDPNVVDWGENKDYAQLLVQQLGWDAAMLPSGSFKFPVGTMFWLRAEVLKPLVQLNLTWDDYPDEPLAQDGSILHALERFFGLLPEQVGLETALTYIPGVSR